MNGYVCELCPLAFEVGYYGYWDLSGGCVKYVCRHCGTMHKIEHLQRQPDMLYAVDGPIRAMVEVSLAAYDGQTCSSWQLPISEDSWRRIGPLPTADRFLRGLFVLPDRAQAVDLDRVACAHCGCVGENWFLWSGRWTRMASGRHSAKNVRCVDRLYSGCTWIQSTEEWRC